MTRDVEDRVLWEKSKSGKFSVKSLYVALELTGSVPFPMSSISRSYAPPPKVDFLLGRRCGRRP